MGADLLGQGILDDLRHEGVDTSLVEVDSTGFTGSLIRETPAPGATRVTYRREGSAGSQLSPAQITREAVEAHSHVHASGITVALRPAARDTVRKLFSQARSARRTISFDMNYRSQLWTPTEAGPVLREYALLADIIIGGRTEWEIAFGSAELTPEMVPNAALSIVTDGDQDIQVHGDGKTVSLSPFPSSVVDPVGAGDGFVGGLIAGLIAGLSTEDAVRQGAYCGSQVVSRLGDWTGLPFGSRGIVEIPHNAGEVRR